jgi:hypothetical protein
MDALHLPPLPIYLHLHHIRVVRLHRHVSTPSTPYATTPAAAATRTQRKNRYCHTRAIKRGRRGCTRTRTVQHQRTIKKCMRIRLDCLPLRTFDTLALHFSAPLVTTPPPGLVSQCLSRLSSCPPFLRRFCLTYWRAVALRTSLRYNTRTHS